MSQKLVCATCLISGNAPPVSRTNGASAYAHREGLGDLLLGRSRLQRAVDRFEDAAIERHQVRDEGDARAELLLDLRGVAMLEHGVGRNAAVILGKVRALGRRLAGSRHTRLRVDDDRAGQQARTMERLERQERRRGIAAWIRHEPGATNLRLVTLGSP